MSKVWDTAKDVVSGVGDAIGDVAEGIYDAGKSIVKGVGKRFKKVWDSKVGKIALLAAAVYTGGWALGAWGPGTGAAAASGGQTAAQGMLASGGGAGTAATGAVNTAAMGATTEAAAMGLPGYSLSGGLSGGPAAAGATGVASAAAGGRSGGIIGSRMGTASMSAADEAAAMGLEAPGLASKGYTAAGGLETGSQVARGAADIFGVIKGMGSGAMDFARERPLLTAMGMNMAGNALSTYQAYEDEKADRRRWERNLMVDDVYVGGPRRRQGIVGSRMGGGS